MDAIERALEESIKRQAAQGAAPKKAVPAAKPSPAPAEKKAVDPFSPEAVLRAANEDDDLYDPYSDYMDQLARSSYEEPCADPWR